MGVCSVGNALLTFGFKAFNTHQSVAKMTVYKLQNPIEHAISDTRIIKEVV